MNPSLGHEDCPGYIGVCTLEVETVSVLVSLGPSVFRYEVVSVL